MCLTTQGVIDVVKGRGSTLFTEFVHYHMWSTIFVKEILSPNRNVWVVRYEFMFKRHNLFYPYVEVRVLIESIQ